MANTDSTNDLAVLEARRLREARPGLTSIINHCITVVALERRENDKLHIVNYSSHLMTVIDNAVCVE